MKKTCSSIIIHKDKILLLLRDNIPQIPDPNKWQTIGGHVEQGETYEEALRREVYEETNLRPSNVHHCGFLKGGYFAMSLYVCYLDDNEKKEVKLGNEGQDLRFFTLEEIEKLPLTPLTKEYFEKYLPQLKRMIKGEIPKPRELGLVKK